MKALTPCLNFNGNAREAFDFYASVFRGEIRSVLKYGDLDMTSGMPDADLAKLAHIHLVLGDDLNIIGSDIPESFGSPHQLGNHVQITIEPESSEEAERLFASLSEGGNVSMPLQPTEWAEQFGECIDRFGIGWMINYTGDVEFSSGRLAAEGAESGAR